MKKIKKQSKPDKIKYFSNELDFAFKNTNSSEKGLTNDEAKERLIKNGKNELPKKKKKTIFAIVIKELLNPITIILMFASLISFIIGEIVDGFVIIAIILIDLIMGTIQERKAERIAQSLSSMIKMNVKVLRNGEKLQIDSKDIVVGDVVYLESGDKISADMRIIDCSNLSVDESVLTGESINSEKQIGMIDEKANIADQKNMVFAGCSVVSGRALCLVVYTGINTEIGKIAENLNNVKDEKSPLDVRINKFSKQMIFLICVTAIIVFVILYLQGYEINEIFLLIIALSVSAIPEGLNLAVTMALTIGSNKMAQKNVIVKSLKSVESLGSCTVIATDKTGTLTINEQTAKIIVLPNDTNFEITGSGYNDVGELLCKDDTNVEFAKEIAMLGELNNEAKLYQHEDKFTNFGDSIDVAFLSLAKKLKINSTEGKSIINRIPYESENKYSAVFYSENDVVKCTVKGSMEKVLEFCKTMQVNGKKEKLDVELLNSQHEKLASKGYRVIALAKGEINNSDSYKESNIEKLTFVGFVGFIDPIRNETIQAISDCKNAGIKIIMITGDHPSTAYAIAKQIGIAKSKEFITTGSEVEKYYNYSTKDFDNFVKSKTVFSRVTPSDKLHIVESLKRQGEFVAVTGDGVNDTPAIKCAHIGIAMGSGTDTAKETADMIITDDNFCSIVEGVKEGRNAYSNIRKVTYMLISTGLAEILFFMLSVVLNLPIPLIALQLLWLNLITDGLQDMALSFEKAENHIMLEKPRNTKESLFSKSLIIEIIISGLFIGLLVFGVWCYLILYKKFDVIYARSLVMALMVFIQNFHALNCRSETQSIFKIPLISNKFFIVSIFGAIGLQILIMEVDLFSNWLGLTSVSYYYVLLLLVLSFSVVGLMELYKVISKARQKRKLKINNIL